jgi:beta-N-acetylhexosaminidase
VHPPAAQVEPGALPTPALDDAFLVFTDDHLEFDCSRCPDRTTLFTSVISQTLGQLAGVPPEQITSLGFADLKAFLNVAPLAENLTDDFARADWIILAPQSLRGEVQQSDAARLLLRNRPELLTGKRVALLAFGPPYELTADDLRPVTVYYALYDTAPPFVEAAVRALFGDLQPAGEPPVSIEAVGYDLTTQTEPDPNQTLRLFVGEAAPSPEAPTPTPPSYHVGDEARVRTGPIRDRNGHAVPDGTPVRFTLIYRDANNATVAVGAMTTGGSAEIAVTIQNNGRLEISAVSEPALKSVVLQLTIAEGEVTAIQTIEPPTPTPTVAPTHTPTIAPTPTPTPTPVGWIDSQLGAEPRRANLIDFALSLLGITLVEAWSFRRASRRKDEGAIDRAVRLALWGSLCGLAAYTGYALGLPGADAIRSALGGWGALAVTLVGALAPWVVDRFRNG